VKKSQENTNQIFLYLNRGLQDYINKTLLSGECYNIINERNIELKTNIITLINNRVQQYIKLYNLKVKYAK